MCRWCRPGGSRGEDGQGPRGEEGAASLLQPSAVDREPATEEVEARGDRPPGEQERGGLVGVFLGESW